MLFWTKVSAIGQVAGALATAAAVILTLWITFSERRAQIKVTAGLRLLIPGDGSPAVDTILIRMTNFGLRAVTVSQLGWRTGYSRFGPRWLRTQYATLLDTPTMFVIEPGGERQIQLQPSWFLGTTAQKTRAEFFNRTYPFARGLGPTRVKLAVHMIAAKSRHFLVEKSLAHFLATGKIQDGAAKFNEKAKAAL